MAVKETVDCPLVEMFGRMWTTEQVGQITFYRAEGENHPDIEAYRRLIPPIVEQLTQIDGVQTHQQVVFCSPDFYWERFLQKAARDGFDPQPWTWSEGDVDTVPQGKVFCVKLGADFDNPAERLRFIGHEMDHPRIHAQTNCFKQLLADSEGIVEADARIALGIQHEPDMQRSTQFITSIPTDKLVPAAEINRVGYDHPSFYGQKPSGSEGYASSMLWFVGLACEAAQRPELSLKEQYLIGREKIMEIARKSQDAQEYKDGLKQIGIDYDSLASNTEILKATQAKFAQ